MHYFRRSLSLGSVVLLAVAMQAAVLMAQMHVHAHSHGAASLYAAARAGQGPERGRGRRASSPSPAGRSSAMLPAGRAARSSQRLPDVLVAGVVGSGVLPAPAAVSLEAPRHQALMPLRVVDRVPVRAGANFQARAPPIV